MTSTESAMSSRLAREYIHSRVAHGDTVAYADGGELDGSPPGLADAGLDVHGRSYQVDVAGMI
jgi:hypothetical protein